jgi:hypothetical protein
MLEERPNKIVAPRSSLFELKPPSFETQAQLDRAHSVKQPGYLGFTSHNTVLEETRNSLLLRDASGLFVSAASRADTVKSGLPSMTLSDLPTPLRETCLAVLRCLPSQSNQLFHLRSQADEAHGWTYVAVDRIVRSLQSGKYDQFLSQGEVGLEAMAEVLCNNTTQPIHDEDSHADVWLDQFAGSTLRWESLGLLWAHLERVSDVLDSCREPCLEWLPGKRSAEKARACLGYCISLSKHLNDGNDVLLDLCRRKATLDSLIDGDASKQNASNFHQKRTAA